MTWLSKILLLQILLLTNSCTGDTIWHKYVNVDIGGWRDNDTISFNLPAASEEGTYPMDIELRTTPSYPYRNLCIVRQILLFHPTDMCRDTIFIQTSKDGQRLGGKGVTIHSFAQPAPDVHLKQGQEACVQLFHIMSRGTMPDIVDVGIKVKRRN